VVKATPTKRPHRLLDFQFVKERLGPKLTSPA
jgi:hypothetical protein